MANEQNERIPSSSNSNSFYGNIHPFVPYYVPHNTYQWNAQYFQWGYQNYNPVYGYAPNHSQRDYFHRVPHQNRQVDTQGNNAYSINGLRLWHKVDNAPKKSFIFSVVSYNVLAQDLLDQHPELYPSQKHEHLIWEYRWRNLMNEFKFFNADILCLQEVQSSHVESYFSVLKQQGYGMLYKKRTGIRTDGCAIFYKNSNLDLLESETVEFKQPKVNLLDRDNVAIIAKFSAKNDKTKEFVISTTHLLYNPKRQDVRIAQLQLLLTEIDRIAYINTDQYLPVIMTGDLNSPPDGVVYRFLTQGRLDYEHLSQRSLQPQGARPKTGKVFLPSFLKITDQCQHAGLIEKRLGNVSISRPEEKKLIEIKNSEDNETYHNAYSRNNHDKALFSTGTLTHSLALRSVYPHQKNNNLATTFQDEWVTVDYIFYRELKSGNNKLTLLERFLLPDKRDLGKMKFPNEIFSSDHLVLAAKFSL